MAAEIRISSSCVFFNHDGGNNGKDLFKRKETFSAELFAFGSDRIFLPRHLTRCIASTSIHTVTLGWTNFFVVNIATEVNGD